MILIPKPWEISYGEGTFACTFGTYIVCEGRAEVLFARRLRDCINQWAGLGLTVVRGKVRRSDIVLAAEKGIHRIYVDYLKELCGFLVQHGKKPMFWGDVICGIPCWQGNCPRRPSALPGDMRRISGRRRTAGWRRPESGSISVLESAAGISG